MTPLAAIIAQRGRASVARSQGRAWLFCEEQVRVDPELREELERTRAARQASIVRASDAGADEAVTLFQRSKEG